MGRWTTYTPGFFSTILLLAERIEASAANLFDVMKISCRQGQAWSAVDADCEDLRDDEQCTKV
jgi:hypothetical protein